MPPFEVDSVPAVIAASLRCRMPPVSTRRDPELANAFAKVIAAPAFAAANQRASRFFGFDAHGIHNTFI